MRTRGGCFFVNREKVRQRAGHDRRTDLASFQDPNGDHRFLRSLSQTDLKNRYEFDRRLRLLLIDGIDHIEVLLRTQLGLHMATTEGAHWYENRVLFRNQAKHREDLLHIDREVKRASEVFPAHFFEKYDAPNRPPSWMVLEVLSFGTISKLSNCYGVPPGFHWMKWGSRRGGRKNRCGNVPERLVYTLSMAIDAAPSYHNGGVRRVYINTGTVSLTAPFFWLFE